MQRQRKYQYWYSGKMLEVGQIEFFTDGTYRVNDELVGGILREWTGLKDKNGKEIYEFDYLGDYCVFWGSGKYILQNISTGEIMDCTNQTTYDKEVTGNRYETPREHTAMETDL